MAFKVLQRQLSYILLIYASSLLFASLLFSSLLSYFIFLESSLP